MQKLLYSILPLFSLPVQLYPRPASKHNQYPRRKDKQQRLECPPTRCLFLLCAVSVRQGRGRFFISPMEQVYEGQVIGEHTRQNDITVNVTKAKQLTNMRASGSDEKTSIAPPKIFSLEEALEYIQADEYVEVTPHSMRLRKILLHEVDRKRASK